MSERMGKKQEKKIYKKPTLEKIGSLVEATLGGGGTKADGVGSMGP